MNGPNEQPRPVGGPSWMVLFADLLALMLTFFVLLFSMNAVQVDGWQAVVASLSQRLAPATPQTVEEAAPRGQAARRNVARAMDLDYLNNLIELKLRGHPVLGQAVLYRKSNAVVIVMPSAMMFTPGTDRLTGAGKQVVFEFGEMFRLITNQININGHAEVEAGGKSPFLNDWDLSLARAIVVARQIRKAGYSREIQSFGMGNARIDEGVIVNLNNEPTRFSRRIEIVVRDMKG